MVSFATAKKVRVITGSIQAICSFALVAVLCWSYYQRHILTKPTLATQRVNLPAGGVDSNDFTFSGEQRWESVAAENAVLGHDWVNSASNMPLDDFKLLCTCVLLMAAIAATLIIEKGFPTGLEDEDEDDADSSAESSADEETEAISTGVEEERVAEENGNGYQYYGSQGGSGVGNGNLDR